MKTSHYYILALLLIALIAGTSFYMNSRDKNAQTNTGSQPVLQDDNTTPSQNTAMSFFLSSTNPGKGADFGGLSGADNFCQELAETAGAGDREWRAYLSTKGSGTSPSVNARDRIGSGPWANFRGEIIANDVDELHADNKISKDTALTEKGGIISGRGDEVNQHDILTGSSPDGRAIASTTDTTCGDWTSSSDEGASAMVGHHDRVGLRDDEPSRSWNSSHLTRGCSAEALPRSGGAGLIYCFAAD